MPKFLSFKHVENKTLLKSVNCLSVGLSYAHEIRSKAGGSPIHELKYIAALRTEGGGGSDHLSRRSREITSGADIIFAIGCKSGEVRGSEKGQSKAA